MAIIYVNNPGNGNNITPDFITALNSAATSGDTIVFPAGSFIFSGEVVTSKVVSVKGAQTISWPSEPLTELKRSDAVSDASIAGKSMIRFRRLSKTMSNIVVSDIAFASKTPSVVDGDGLSLALDYGLSFEKTVGWIVTRCKFKYFGDSGIVINHYDDTANGLVAKCDFYHNFKGFDAQGYGYGISIYGEDLAWLTGLTHNSNNYVYIENCTFDAHRHSIAGGGCGKYVFRYDTITDNRYSENNASAHAIDLHGARFDDIGGGNYFSTRLAIVYNNSITLDKFFDGTPIVTGHSVSDLVENCILVRGGEIIAYNNTISGYRFGIGLYVETDPTPGTYPVLYSIGYESGLSGPSNPNGDAGDAFIYNNTFTSYDGNVNSVGFYNFDPTKLLNGRDYHLSARSGYTQYPYPHPLRANLADVTISTPGGSVLVPINTQLTFTANTINFDFPISSVQFYVNNALVGTDTTSAYTLNYTATTAGSYNVLAVATDVSGVTTSSQTLTFTAQTSSISANITGNTSIKLGYTSSATTLGVGITGGTSPFTYLWSTSSTASTITVSPTATTTYNVTVTDSLSIIGTGSTIVNVEDVRCNNNVVSTLKYNGGANRALCLPTNTTTLMYTHLGINPNRNIFYMIIGTY